MARLKVTDSVVFTATAAAPLTGAVLITVGAGGLSS
jgi:hypothetical protein